MRWVAAVVVSALLLCCLAQETEGSMATIKIGNLEVTDLRGQLPANGDYPKRDIGAIKRITFHHTAGAKRDYTAREIAVIQLGLIADTKTGKKFPGFAYHFMVHWDKTIDYVQDINRATWHGGPANADSISIVIAGNWENDIPPDDILDTARDLVANLQLAMGVWYPVDGHQDHMQTTCPSRLWPQWRERVTVRQPVAPPEPTPDPDPDYKALYLDLKTRYDQEREVAASVKAVLQWQAARLPG